MSRREHSVAELEFKLERRGHDESTISDIVGTLAASGWQSDERYAEMLVRSRAAQGYGPLRIEHELSQAGVADALLRSALAQADVDWAARCAQLHARRFRRAPAGAADWQKQYRYLASHGFTAEHIRGVLKRTPEDSTDAL